MSGETTFTTSTAFMMSKLGQHANTRFAERIASLGLRPRHCGVLALLEADHPNQLTIAEAMGVSGSVVVDMLDELEELGAVRRIREVSDRRRQRVEITTRGRSLARKARQLAMLLDEELLAPLSPAQVAHLRAALSTLAAAHGVPGGSTRAPAKS